MIPPSLDTWETPLLTPEELLSGAQRVDEADLANWIGATAILLTRNGHVISIGLAGYDEQLDQIEVDYFDWQIRTLDGIYRLFDYRLSDVGQDKLPFFGSRYVRVGERWEYMDMLTSPITHIGLDG